MEIFRQFQKLQNNFKKYHILSYIFKNYQIIRYGEYSMVDKKSFNNEIRSFAKEKGYKYKTGIAMLLHHKDEIMDAIESGNSKRMLWEFMREKGYYEGAYTSFTRHLQQLLKQSTKTDQSTPERSAAQAPSVSAIPAAKTPPTPAPAPAAGQQMPAKPPTEPKGFEYHAPTPEEIRKMMSGEE